MDFWGVWCGPCRVIAPIVEGVARDFEGRIKVGKLDVDNNPRAAMSYGIRSIPTLLVFKGGQPVEQIIGAVPKSEIVKALNNHVAQPV